MNNRRRGNDVIGVASGMESSGQAVATRPDAGTSGAWLIPTYLGLLAVSTAFARDPRVLMTLRPGQEGQIGSVAFSPDGKILASAGPNQATQLWEVPSGQPVRRFQTSGYAVAAAFSPDGRNLATGGATDAGDANVLLWDLATGKQVRRFPSGKGRSSEITCMAFSPQGESVIAGGVGGEIHVWDATSGQVKATFQGNSGVLAVAFSQDGRFLAYGGTASNFGQFDLQARKPSVTLNEGTTARARDGHTGSVNSLAFSPDGRTLATGSEDRSVRFWDVASGKVAGILLGHSDEVSIVAFSPDGKTLASGSRDGTIRLWDVAGVRTSTTFDGHSGPVTSVAFCPNGKTLASRSREGDIKLWKLPPSERAGE